MASKFFRFFSPQRPFGMLAFFILAAATTLVDQLSKFFIVLIFQPVVSLDPLTAGPILERAANPIELIPNCFHFMFRINTGAAFSALTDHTTLLTGISILISLGVVGWAWMLKPGEQGLRLSQALIFGGAIGNLIDRIRLGYVIDFLDAHWGETLRWPTFNIADSAICVGIGLLFIASFFATQPTQARSAEGGAGKKNESAECGMGNAE